ncbi:MAG: hypothetical protein L3J39_03915 [Verrucomicrobiales bacterium]|nr:hypothetical protein [Verrucomicrobiales bacterium]
MDTQNQILRVGIEGRWTATEMASSLKEINFLYDLRLYLNAIEETEPYLEEMSHFYPPFQRYGKSFLFARYAQPLHQPEDLNRNTKIIFPEHVLRVSQIKYASPGIKDLLGLEGVLKEVRLFIQYLLDRDQQREAQELDNQGKRIKNARDFAKLRVESARADKEIEMLSSDGYGEIVEDNTRQLSRLVEERKIVSIEMLEGEPNQKE